MLHGKAFVQYDWQGDSRGSNQLGSSIGAMAAASRPARRRPAPAPGDAQRLSVDHRQPRLSLLVNRGVLPGRAAARSAAPARLFMELSASTTAGGPESWALALPRSGRRAGGGPCGFPAPAGPRRTIRWRRFPITGRTAPTSRRGRKPPASLRGARSSRLRVQTAGSRTRSDQLRLCRPAADS